MAETSFGTLETDAGSAPKLKAATPFRIGVIGDFSGRACRGDSDGMSGRRWVRLDIDEFDDTVAGFKIALNLPDVADDLTIHIQGVDGFDADELIDRVEKFDDFDKPAEKANFLRTILHNPHFRALEGIWRSLYWLIRHMPAERKIEIHLLDASWDEVVADLNSSDDLSQCGLHELMVEWPQKPNGEPWGVFVGNFSLQPTVEHANLLGRLAKLARAAYAPFLGAVDAQVMDKTFKLSGDDADAWQELRQLPEANMLGLATPGFLLRLPYGENTKSVAKFKFEEQDPTVKGKTFLWGNPAFACAALLGQGFATEGWGFKPGAALDLENMPIYVFEDDFDKVVTVAERWVTSKDAQQAGKVGAMALMAVKGKDALHLSQLVALADGWPPLAGPWEKGAGVPKAPGKPKVQVGVAMTAGGAAATAAAAQSFAEKKGVKFDQPAPAQSFAEKKGINLDKLPDAAQSFSESGASSGLADESGGRGGDWDPNKAMFEELKNLSAEEMKARFGPKEEESTESTGGDLSSFGESTDTSMDFSSETPAESTAESETPVAEDMSWLESTETPAESTDAPTEGSGDSTDLDALLKELGAGDDTPT